MTYHHLNSAERVVIANMLDQGRSQREVARALRRSPATISRELRRNGGRAAPYAPHLANWESTKRRQRCRPKPKRDDERLMGYVEARLREAWSPEQIVGRLRRISPRNPKRRISHETIYRHVRADKRRGGKLYCCLRHGKRKYNKRYAYCPTRGRIKDRVGIEHRPKSVQLQRRHGDWEGDTMTGRAHSAHVVTLVERKTLYLRAHWVPDLKTRSVNDAILALLTQPGTPPIHTITVDNGVEFSAFKELEAGLDCNVYFTRPYCAWDKPINENTNGLLRQFLPKKTNFADLTQDQILAHVDQLNHRPRKKLNYRTPQEAVQRYRVALRG